MTKGDLKPKEPHPAALSAIKYVSARISDPLLKEALASCAIENNRMAEICLGTIKRIENGEPVSDRYLLGLAWFLKEMEEKN